LAPLLLLSLLGFLFLTPFSLRVLLLLALLEFALRLLLPLLRLLPCPFVLRLTLLLFLLRSELGLRGGVFCLHPGALRGLAAGEVAQRHAWLQRSIVGTGAR